MILHSWWILTKLTFCDDCDLPIKFQAPTGVKLREEIAGRNVLYLNSLHEIMSSYEACIAKLKSCLQGAGNPGDTMQCIQDYILCIGLAPSPAPMKPMGYEIRTTAAGDCIMGEFGMPIESSLLERISKNIVEMHQKITPKDTVTIPIQSERKELRVSLTSGSDNYGINHFRGSLFIPGWGTFADVGGTYKIGRAAEVMATSTISPLAPVVLAHDNKLELVRSVSLGAKVLAGENVKVDGILRMADGRALEIDTIFTAKDPCLTPEELAQGPGGKVILSVNGDKVLTLPNTPLIDIAGQLIGRALAAIRPFSFEPAVIRAGIFAKCWLWGLTFTLTFVGCTASLLSTPLTTVAGAVGAVACFGGKIGGLASIASEHP